MQEKFIKILNLSLFVKLILQIFYNIQKASPAGARETARRVQADVLAASTSSRTFVYVFAMGLQSSLLITIVAYALIGTHHILADTI